MTDSTGPLAGLRVADLSTLLAGPQIGAVLADFGADVVKIEPPDGDPLQRLGARRAGTSLPYTLVNRGKQRVVLDWTSPTGRETLHRLLRGADVIVTNQPRPLLERWGCTPEELLERDPRAIVVTVSCFGWSGPLADRPGNGSIAESFAGLTHLTGEPDEPPVLPSVPLGDSLVGMAGALSVLAACWYRDAGAGRVADRQRGGGQHLDVSMFEPIVTLLGTTLTGWDPETDPPSRTGSRVAGGAPRNVYRGSDGRYLVLSATTDAQARRVLAEMGLDDETHLERFGDGASRARLADELDGLVADWIGGRTRDAALAALDVARVPVAPVHDLRELIAHPQVRARGSVVMIDGGEAGDIPVPGPVATFSATPAGATDGPGPEVTIDEISARWKESG